MMSVSDIRNGDIQAAARLMRDIEENSPAARPAVRRLFQYAGNAHVIGVTGPPGTGKSTLIDRVVQQFREIGKTVGVIAVDPTSPFSGGAILGDRLRMQRHATDPGVFIRSLATRGQPGGIARAAGDMVVVMDAMGKDVVLVESVGVGQSEVDILLLVQTNIVVTMPGLGDGVQTIKAGVMESGDIFVVNKADLYGADMTQAVLESMLAIQAAPESGWKPPVLKTACLAGTGIDELLSAILRHRKATGNHRRSRTRRRLAEKQFLNMLGDRLRQHALQGLEQSRQWKTLLDDVRDRRCSPYDAVEQFMDRWVKGIDP